MSSSGARLDPTLVSAAVTEEIQDRSLVELDGDGLLPDDKVPARLTEPELNASIDARVPPLATEAEAVAGADAARITAPAGVKAAIMRQTGAGDPRRVYRSFHAQLAAGGSQVYVLGHSVVNGSSATVPAKEFGQLVKAAIRSVDPTALVAFSAYPGEDSGQILAHFAASPVNSTYTSLTICMCLINDLQHSIDPATTEANIAALVAKMKALQPAGSPTPGFLLLLEWDNYNATATHTWDEYRQAAYNVATADPSVRILDLGARMGSALTAANLDGYFASDQAHPLNKGHMRIAQDVAEEILPQRNTGQGSLVQIDPKAGPAAITVGTWANQVSASYVGNGTYINTSNAQNDAATWSIVLAPGTWAFDITAGKSVNSAIVTVEIDDGSGNFTSIGTVDLYNSSSIYNTVTSITGVSLPAVVPVSRLIRLKAATRNASNTTGWYMPLQYIQARRTSAIA